MTTPPLAHAGHWLAQVAYVVPLLLVVIALAVSKVRERRGPGRARGRRRAPAGGGRLGRALTRAQAVRAIGCVRSQRACSAASARSSAAR